VDKDYRLEGPSEPRTAVEKLIRALSGEKHDFAHSSADTLKGQVQRVFNGFETFNDPRGIYARMPFDVILR